MPQEERVLAVDCKYLGLGTPGDGVPATTFTQYPTIHEGSLVFGFSQANQVSFKKMGSEEPWAVINRMGDPSYIEFAIPSPTAQECAKFMGGTAVGEKWEKPITTPIIEESLKIQTADYNGKYVEYVATKASISAYLSQAPTEEETELLLVRATILSATTSAGVRKTAFSREIKSITPEG